MCLGCGSGRVHRFPLLWASSGHISRREGAGSQKGEVSISWSRGQDSREGSGVPSPFLSPIGGAPHSPESAGEVLGSPEGEVLTQFPILAVDRLYGV